MLSEKTSLLIALAIGAFEKDLHLKSNMSVGSTGTDVGDDNDGVVATGNDGSGEDCCGDCGSSSSSGVSIITRKVLGMTGATTSSSSLSLSLSGSLPIRK